MTWHAPALSSLLRWCGKSKSLQKGRLVHHCLLESTLSHDACVVNLLLHMYGQCRAFPEAVALFHGFYQRDVSSWNTVIKACFGQGQLHEGLQYYSQMFCEGILPDKMTFVYLLSGLAAETHLVDCKRLHTHIISNNFEADVYVGTNLITLYGSRASLENALMVFDRMLERNEITWTALIASCNNNEQCDKALQHFENMQQQAVLPERVTFVTAIAACAVQVQSSVGKRLHACLVAMDMELDVVIGTALLNMHGRYANLEEARLIFNRMPRRNVVSWSAMMTLYTDSGEGSTALQLFEEMQYDRVRPNRVTLLSVVAACAAEAAIHEGMQLHSFIINSEFQSDMVLSNAIISMYGDLGCVDDAERVFRRMIERSVVSWNALIAVYNAHGQAEDALKVFGVMLEKAFVPDESTFVNILSACSILRDPACGKWVHGFVLENGFDLDVVVGTSLVIMYGDCGSLEDAERLFDRMLERDTTSWNAILAVCDDHGQSKKAIHYFDQMQRRGMMPDKVTFNTVLFACADSGLLAEGKRIHAQILERKLEAEDTLQNALLYMYGKCGSLDCAEEVFMTVVNHTVISLTVMLALYVQYEKGEKSFELFLLMQEQCITPNKVAYHNLLTASANQVAVAAGKRIHLHVLASGSDLDVEIQNAVLNMYGKFGNLEDAHRVFDSVVVKDIVSWNGIISAYAQHGEGWEVLCLFGKMQQQSVLPDSSTFIKILTACSHAGYVLEGCQFLNWMDMEFSLSVKTDHFICIIDLLGRAGQLNEAEVLNNSMPFQPTSVSFLAVLGACRHVNDYERAEDAARHVLELSESDAAPLVMLSNIYEAACQVQHASHLLEEIKIQLYNDRHRTNVACMYNV